MNNKIYTLKISLDKTTFRIIEIRGYFSLYELAETILKSFKFDMDHAFGFYNNIKNIYKSDEIYELFFDIEECNVTEESKSVENTEIHAVFEIKKKMAFLFDYGDEWIFIVECKNISDPIAKTKYPRIIEKLGKAPKQYN